MRPNRPWRGRNRASGTASTIRIIASSGVDIRHCNSARSRGSSERQQRPCGLHLGVGGAAGDFAEANRNAALGKFDDAKLAASRSALVALAVVEHERLFGLSGAALLRARRHPDFELVGVVGSRLTQRRMRPDLPRACFRAVARRTHARCAGSCCHPRVRRRRPRGRRRTCENGRARASRTAHRAALRRAAPSRERSRRESPRTTTRQEGRRSRRRAARSGDTGPPVRRRTTGSPPFRFRDTAVRAPAGWRGRSQSARRRTDIRRKSRPISASTTPRGKSFAAACDSTRAS